VGKIKSAYSKLSLPNIPLFNDCVFFTDFSLSPLSEAYDKSPYKNQTTAVTGSIDVVSGPANQATVPLFNGSNTLYELTYDDSFNLDSGNGYTIFAFVKRTGNNTGFRQIFSKQFASTASSPFLDWMLANSNNNIAWRVGFGAASTSVSIDLDVWNHFVMTGDGARLQIYKNGVQEYDVAAVYTPSNTNSITPKIGALNFTGTPAEHWLGAVAQAGLWDRHLNANEVAELYDYSLGKNFSVTKKRSYFAFDYVPPPIEVTTTAPNLEIKSAYFDIDLTFTNLVNKNHTIIPGADGIRRSNDPYGQFGYSPSYSAPVIDKTGLTSSTTWRGDTEYSTDEYVTNGSTWTYTPSLSTTPSTYNWYLEARLDGCTIDKYTGQVTLDTSTLPTIQSNQPDMSDFITIGCDNAAGTDKIHIRLHIGKTSGQVRFVGPSETYTTVLAATNAMSAGDTIVVRNGTYTDATNDLLGANNYLISGTAATHSTIMAETPTDCKFDGQGSNVPMGLYGNSSSPDFSPGSGQTSYTQEYIDIRGFTLVNSGSFNCFICRYGSYVTDRYMIVEDTNNFAGTVNNVIHEYKSMENGTGEFNFVHGHGRYLHSCFEANKITYKACFARQTIYGGTQPGISAVSFYRGEFCYSANTWAIDFPDYDNFPTALTAPSQTQAFQHASTGAFTHGEGNEYNGCGSINVCNGGFHSFPDSVPTPGMDIKNYAMIDTDIAPHNTGLVRLSSGRNQLNFDGGVVYDAVIDYGTVSCFTSIRQISIDNSIIKLSDGNDKPLADATGGEEVFYDNVSITGLNGQPLTALAADENVVDRVDNAPTPANGLKYPFRIEDGSTFETQGVGPSAEFRIGKLGTFYDDADHKTVTTDPVFPYPFEDKWLYQMQNYQFTIPTEYAALTFPDAVGGIIYGNYGIADGTEQSVSGYIITSLGGVHFPLNFGASQVTAANSVRCSWSTPAGAYFDGILQYRVYVRNVTDAGTASVSAFVSRLNNDTTITGLTSGKTYEFYVTAVRESDGVESGPSYKSQVAIP